MKISMKLCCLIFKPDLNERGSPNVCTADFFSGQEKGECVFSWYKLYTKGLLSLGSTQASEKGNM